MQSNRARAAIALGAIAVAVVLFIVLRGDDNNDSSTRTTQQATPSGQELSEQPGSRSLSRLRCGKVGTRSSARTEPLSG